MADHRVFRLDYDRYCHVPSGREQDFIVMHCPDWVHVLPLTPDRQVVMVRQFRFGIREVTLELPGGVVDPGESPLTAAARELREETGYDGGRLAELGSLRPNPALMNNRCHYFLADGVELRHALELDPFEAIEVELQPLANIPELIRQGRIAHSLVIAAFAYIGVTAAGVGLHPPALSESAMSPSSVSPSAPPPSAPPPSALPLPGESR